MLRRLALNLILAVSIVLTSSIVLMVRSTSDALMGANSLAGAVRTVTACALPTLLIYTFLIHGRWLIIATGLGLGAWLAQMWWGVATDWHSTASLGPMLQGWILGPAVLLTVAVIALPASPNKSTSA